MGQNKWNQVRPLQKSEWNQIRPSGARMETDRSTRDTRAEPDPPRVALMCVPGVNPVSGFVTRWNMKTASAAKTSALAYAHIIHLENSSYW